MMKVPINQIFYRIILWFSYFVAFYFMVSSINVPMPYGITYDRSDLLIRLAVYLNVYFVFDAFVAVTAWRITIITHMCPSS